MLYAAKCFWPGVTADELRLAVDRARSLSDDGYDAHFRGALRLPKDEVVLCLFESSSSVAVKQASEHAGIPCERVIETVWIDADDGMGSRPSEGGSA
jgi:hypothetical protein